MHVTESGGAAYMETVSTFEVLVICFAKPESATFNNGTRLIESLQE
jgi:hypothetical protein